MAAHSPRANIHLFALGPAHLSVPPFAHTTAGLLDLLGAQAHCCYSLSMLYACGFSSGFGRVVIACLMSWGVAMVCGGHSVIATFVRCMLLGTSATARLCSALGTATLACLRWLPCMQQFTWQDDIVGVAHLVRDCLDLINSLDDDGDAHHHASMLLLLSP
jgi:hypothetical protein